MATITAISDMRDTPLFKLDGWHIVKTAFPVRQGVDCFAIHVTCKGREKSYGFDVVSDDWADGKCFRCDAMIPDEVHALVMLYNWRP